MIHHQGRVSIIGAGTLGGTIAYSLLLTNIAKEILLVDRSENIVQGQVLDLEEALACSSDLQHDNAANKDPSNNDEYNSNSERSMPTVVSGTTIRAGTFKEAGQSTLIIFTADILEPPSTTSASKSNASASSSPLNMTSASSSVENSLFTDPMEQQQEEKTQQRQQAWLRKSRHLLLSIASSMSPVHPDIMILVTSNPVDLYVQSLQSYFPHVNPRRIFGIGHTTFATRRFRKWLINQLVNLEQSEQPEQSYSSATAQNGRQKVTIERNNTGKNEKYSSNNASSQPTDAAQDTTTTTTETRLLFDIDNDIDDAYVLGSRRHPFALYDHAKIKGIPLPSIHALALSSSTTSTVENLISSHRYNLICERKGQAWFTMAALATRITHELLFHMPFNRPRQNSIASTISLSLSTPAALTLSSTLEKLGKQQPMRSTAIVNKGKKEALAKAQENRYWVLSVYVPEYDCCMSWPVYLGASGVERLVDLKLSKEEKEQVSKVAEDNLEDFRMSFAVDDA